MEPNVPESYLLESRAPTLQGVMWTVAIVPLMFVAMRLYVRIYLRRVFGWDDFIIIIAICCLIAPLLWWAAVEDGLAITAASIPALKPLLVRVFPSSSANDNYNMISYPPAPHRKVFDNSDGETQTDIGHTSVHDQGSQTAILEPDSTANKEENINMTTKVSVTYNRTP